MFHCTDDIPHISDLVCFFLFGEVVNSRDMVSSDPVYFHFVEGEVVNSNVRSGPVASANSQVHQLNIVKHWLKLNKKSRVSENWNHRHRMFLILTEPNSVSVIRYFSQRYNVFLFSDVIKLVLPLSEICLFLFNIPFFLIYHPSLNKHEWVIFFKSKVEMKAKENL